MTASTVVSEAFQAQLDDIEGLVARLIQGEVRALAQVLTLIEAVGRNCRQLECALFAHRGHARVVGFTGPPGAGKSTLINRYVAERRARQGSVVAILVDPTSPISGGALLGDRVRMGSHSLDPKVFIRSMASRGHLGGLTYSMGLVIQAASIAGWDEIVIETVGTGQSEVEIADTADVTVVVWVPGLGDEVQALKAGILEIGDIIVINKADSPDADRTARQIESMLALRSFGLAPPVLQTVATDGTGVSDLLGAVDTAIGRRRHVAQPSEVPAIQGAEVSRAVETRVLDGELHHAVRTILKAVERGELSADAAAASLWRLLCLEKPEEL